MNVVDVFASRPVLNYGDIAYPENLKLLFVTTIEQKCIVLQNQQIYHPPGLNPVLLLTVYDVLAALFTSSSSELPNVPFPHQLQILLNSLNKLKELAEVVEKRIMNPLPNKSFHLPTSFGVMIDPCHPQRIISDIEKAETGEGKGATVASAKKTAIHSSIDHGTLFGEGNSSVWELHGVSPIDSPVSQVDFPDISLDKKGLSYVPKSNTSTLSSGTILSEMSSPFVEVDKRHVHSVGERCGSRRAICNEQLSQFGPVTDWSDDNDSFELLSSFPFLKGANIEPLPSPPDVLLLIDEQNRFLVYSFENDQIYVFGRSFEEGFHNYLVGSETGYQGVSERVDDNTGEGMKDTVRMGSEVFMISVTTRHYNSRELALSHIQKWLQDCPFILDKVSSMENTTKLFPTDYQQSVMIEVCVFEDGAVVLRRSVGCVEKLYGASLRTQQNTK